MSLTTMRKSSKDMSEERTGCAVAHSPVLGRCFRSRRVICLRNGGRIDLNGQPARPSAASEVGLADGYSMRSMPRRTESSNPESSKCVAGELLLGTQPFKTLL